MKEIHASNNCSNKLQQQFATIAIANTTASKKFSKKEVVFDFLSFIFIAHESKLIVVFV